MDQILDYTLLRRDTDNHYWILWRPRTAPQDPVMRSISRMVLREEPWNFLKRLDNVTPDQAQEELAALIVAEDEKDRVRRVKLMDEWLAERPEPTAEEVADMEEFLKSLGKG
jgi:hypothetical protein